MPLFEINKTKLASIEQSNFNLEKDLQSLIEQNMGVVFNSRLVASEFITGARHAGRIDTLAISEDSNPVIIEYKKVESSDLINQSLFYLSWINDHRGDFEIAARNTLGNDVHIDWSDIRVICIAPNYKKYDLHAVQMMGANIELWTYRLFKSDHLYLEEVFRKSFTSPGSVNDSSGKNPIMVTAGKKAAMTRATGSYSVEHHLKGRTDKITKLFIRIQEFILGLDPAIEECPRKYIISYKISQNIACVEIKKSKILIFLKLTINDIDVLPDNARDVTSIGHLGTGDIEVSIDNSEQLESAKPLITKAYQKIGG